MFNIPIFNSTKTASDIKFTNTGPIACINGIWYSVNGNKQEIVDVRFPLTDKERTKYSVTNN
jgi:hypothetical protein